MRKHHLAATAVGGLTIGVLLLASTAAWSGRATYAPYPGAVFIYDRSVEQQVHVLKIDLTSKKIRIRITSRRDALTTAGAKVPMGPHQFAKKRAIQMAINGSIGGDPAGEPFMHLFGLIKGYGEMWPLQSEGLNIYMHGDVRSCPQAGGGAQACSSDGLFAFSADNQRLLLETACALSFSDNVVPDEYDVAAAGRPVVVWDGVPLPDLQCPYAGPDYPATGRQPRTAYGLTQDRKTLILLVVDGRRSGCVGKGYKALGQLMQAHGAHWAFNLDGGGSSAMYIKGFSSMTGSTAYPDGIVNRPSDGSVRTVPLQIGVQVVKPLGHLSGFVRRDDPGTGAPLAGATVTVTYADAQCATRTKSAVAGADGAYAVSEIDAGSASIVVEEAGSRRWAQTLLIAAGDTNHLDFGLAPSGSTASGSSKRGLATPAADLLDPQAANASRLSLTPIPAAALESTDSDPDFPKGAPRDGGLPPDLTGPDSRCTLPDAALPRDAAPAPGDGAASSDARPAASDGGAAAEAGRGADPRGGGCGCSAVAAAPELLGLLALAAALLAPRRRSRRRRV